MTTDINAALAADASLRTAVRAASNRWPPYEAGKRIQPRPYMNATQAAHPSSSGSVQQLVYVSLIHVQEPVTVDALTIGTNSALASLVWKGALYNYDPDATGAARLAVTASMAAPANGTEYLAALDADVTIDDFALYAISVDWTGATAPNISCFVDGIAGYLGAASGRQLAGFGSDLFKGWTIPRTTYADAFPAVLPTATISVATPFPFVGMRVKS